MARDFLISLVAAVIIAGLLIGLNYVSDWCWWRC